MLHVHHVRHLRAGKRRGFLGKRKRRRGKHPSTRPRRQACHAGQRAEKKRRHSEEGEKKEEEEEEEEEKKVCGHARGDNFLNCASLVGTLVRGCDMNTSLRRLCTPPGEPA